MSDVLVARCLMCTSEFTEEQIKGVSCCPTCGNRGAPADPANDVTITINTHELKILGMWAMNWAQRACPDDRPGYDSPGVVKAILTRIKAQFPERLQEVPLTMGEEVEAIRTAIESGRLGDARIVSTNIPRDPDLPTKNQG